MSNAQLENLSAFRSGGMGRMVLQKMRSDVPQRILEVLKDHGQEGFIGRDGVAYGICDSTGKHEPLPTMTAAKVWLGY